MKDLNLSPLTNEATIDKVTYDFDTNEITVEGKHVPKQTIPEYGMGDWNTVNDAEGRHVLDLQLWDEREDNRPDDYGFQFAMLRIDDTGDFIEIDDYDSIGIESIEFINDPEDYSPEETMKRAIKALLQELDILPEPFRSKVEKELSKHTDSNVAIKLLTEGEGDEANHIMFEWWSTYYKFNICDWDGDAWLDVHTLKEAFDKLYPNYTQINQIVTLKVGLDDREVDVQYELRVIDGRLCLDPINSEELEALCPHGTVMEFFNYDLSIYKFNH